jgi:hypothetical protein
MLDYLRATPDARLLGPSGPFTLLDRAALENLDSDSLHTVPGDVVRELEIAGHIEPFDVADKTRVAFRISTKGRIL